MVLALQSLFVEVNKNGMLTYAERGDFSFLQLYFEPHEVQL